MSALTYHITATLLLAIPATMSGFVVGAWSGGTGPIAILVAVCGASLTAWLLPRFPWVALALFLGGFTVGCNVWETVGQDFAALTATASRFLGHSPRLVALPEYLIPWPCLITGVAVCFFAALHRPTVKFNV